MSNVVVPINNKVVKILESAKAKIANPGQWIRGTFARNSIGESVGYLSPACYYDMAGSVLSLTTKYNRNSIKLALTFLTKHAKNIKPNIEYISDFNDDKEVDHNLVMKIFDLSLEEASSWRI